MSKILIVGAALMAVIVLSLIMTASHWWKSYSGATVTYNGQIASEINVYRSPEGSVLVRLKQGEDLYVIHPKSGEIGIPNRSDFFIVPGYAYSRNVPPLLAPMGKAEIDPELRIEQEYIEFSATDKGRVRVTW